MGLSKKIVLEGISLIESFYSSLKINQQVDLNLIDRFLNNLIFELKKIRKSEIIIPIPLQNIQSYTVIHSLNVTIYSILFGLSLKKNSIDLVDIGMGALLHDIGKINTPDHLVWMQETNDNYDNTTIAEHPVHGAKWIENNYSMPENVTTIIREHHECYDGSGYPAGLTGRNYNSIVNIVAICNVYDYLVTSLPGKPGLDPRDALFEIHQNSERKFHPKYVSAFLNVMGPHLMREPLYRKTALVLLDSKEVAAVMNVKKFGDVEPEILVLTNTKGKKLDRPIPINLKYDNSRRIVKLLQVG